MRAIDHPRVFSPTTISSSGIFINGREVKTNERLGLFTPVESPVTGGVEVLDANSASGAMCGSISAYTFCLSA